MLLGPYDAGPSLLLLGPSSLPSSSGPFSITINPKPIDSSDTLIPCPSLPVTSISISSLLSSPKFWSPEKSPERVRDTPISSSPPPPNSLTGVVSASEAAADVDEQLIYPPSALAASMVKPVTMRTLLEPGVVVYDGVCHLCHNGVKWVIRADKYKKIKFCCLQSKAAEPYLSVCGLDREDVHRRFLFVEGPGMYHQASTAALKVLSHLPLPYSALSVFLILPTPLRDAVYDYVANHRYDWFGKADECLVLKEKDLLERFIDREEMMDG